MTSSTYLDRCSSRSFHFPKPIILTLRHFALSAFAQMIEYQSESGIDLRQYKTCGWQREKDATHPEKTIDEMFVRAIDSELSKKGIIRTENGGADLIVIYRIAILGDVEWSAGHSTIPFIGEGSIAGGPVEARTSCRRVLSFWNFTTVRIKADMAGARR